MSVSVEILYVDHVSGNKCLFLWKSFTLIMFPATNVCHRCFSVVFKTCLQYLKAMWVLEELVHSNCLSVWCVRVCVCAAARMGCSTILMCVLGCTEYKECVMPNQFMNGKKWWNKTQCVFIMHVFLHALSKEKYIGNKATINVMHSKHDIAQMIKSHSQNGWVFTCYERGTKERHKHCHVLVSQVLGVRQRTRGFILVIIHGVC